MRYMMLLSGNNPAAPPPPELFEAIMKLGGEATQAGVLLDTAGLLPSASGARVSLADGDREATGHRPGPPPGSLRPQAPGGGARHGSASAAVRGAGRR